MALADQFTNLWKADEASGDLLDAIGGVDLTAQNSPGSSTGILGGCRTFNGSNQYFSTSNSALLSPGDTDWSFYAWFYPTSFASNSQVFSKRNSNGNPEYNLWINTSGRPVWGIGGTGSDQTWGSAVSLNSWHLAVVFHSATSNQKGMSIDGSAFTAVSTSGAAATYSVPFRVGAKNSAPVIEYFAGSIDEIGHASGYVPTNADAATIWNGGDGLAHPFTISSAVRNSSIIGAGFGRLIGA